jgi:hypothetical protein
LRAINNLPPKLIKKLLYKENLEEITNEEFLAKLEFHLEEVRLKDLADEAARDRKNVEYISANGQTKGAPNTEVSNTKLDLDPS